MKSEDRKAFEKALSELAPVGISFSLKWNEEKCAYASQFTQLHWVMWNTAANK